VEKAAYDRARREALRPAVAGGTVSASGAGGGGTEALDPLMNHDVEMADDSAVASSLLRSIRFADELWLCHANRLLLATQWAYFQCVMMLICRCGFILSVHFTWKVHYRYQLLPIFFNASGQFNNAVAP
jgi:hypothetical protein